MNQPPLPLDWNVLNVPGVADLARRAASYVASTHTTVYLDEDDLFQEACLILAHGHDRVRSHAEAGHYGLISKELQHDLINKVATELRRSNKNLSHERLVEEAAA